MLNIDEETLARIVDDAVKAEREAIAVLFDGLEKVYEEDHYKATADNLGKYEPHYDEMVFAALEAAMGEAAATVRARGES